MHLQVEYQYCPQIGDRLVYFLQGHQEMLSNFPEQRSPPWMSFAQQWPVVECIVREISFDFPDCNEYRRCKSVIAHVTLGIVRVPTKWTLAATNGLIHVDFSEPRVTRNSIHSKEQTFDISIRNDSYTFVVPYFMFERAMKQPWREGQLTT